METADTADTADTATDTSNEPVASIEGSIVDMMGSPLPSPLLQFCGPIDAEGNVELCIPIPVDGASGAFNIDVMFVGLWSLKLVQGPVDGRNFAGQAFQIDVAQDDAIDLGDPIILPEVSEALTPLAGATAVTIDEVLSVTVDPAMAQSPDFLMPTELGGLAPGSETWRVSEIEGNPVLAAWTFSPFGIKSTMGGFDFTVSGNLGLGAGDSVVFWEIEKDNGELHEIATGTVNGDASAIDVVATGEGLHELTWLLVTQ